MPETEEDAALAARDEAPAETVPRRRRLQAQLRSISGQLQVIPTGARARLRRMDPEAPGRAAGDVVALLLNAGVAEDEWSNVAGTPRGRERGDDGFRRWARICHLIATLAGAGARETHVPVQERDAAGATSGPRRPHLEAGRAIEASGYSETRLMRLTSARGSALADQARRLARYLAQAGTVPLDLTPVAELLLFEGRDETRADAARLDLARAYYRAERGASAKPENKPENKPQTKPEKDPS